MSDRCPSCDATAWRPSLEAHDMYTGERYPLEACSQCGLLRTRGGLDDASSLYLYDGDADAGSRFGKLVEPLMVALRRNRVRTIERAHPGGPGRLLDVGCGRGAMLKALAKRGWSVRGTELDAAVARSAQRSLGERIHIGPIESLKSRAPFDVITFWHVLEHLENPRAALEHASSLLTENGAILIGVPNLDSWQARWFGAHWLHLDVPRHRWHFSQETLTSTAERAGLTLTECEHFSFEYGPFGMFQSAVAKSGLGHTLFTRLLRRRNLPQLLKEPRAWAHLAAAPLLAGCAFASFPIEAAAALLHRGGCILATFKKR